MGRRQGYAVGEARRERILHTAMQEFAEHGYRGASLARIAERCELSQPGLLHHFPSKERLLVAVLELRDRMDAERIGHVTGAAMLHALADLVERNSRVPGLVQLFTVLSGEAVTADHPAHTWATERYRALRAALTEAFREAVAAGDFRPDTDPESQADRLIAVMDGLQLQWLLEPDRVDMPKIFRAHIEDLLKALRP
ncbi:TetR/AcrR family transcriptional regulator [Bailinhaonella thermotolerans]|uniref:TetR/AcrR family transcriptional regulator n=1 Tax=Bailinhaonella thermotolerans TaxID=1070861 RepID=UPI001F5B27D9|nr:TetR/AcrR family transcriptional regulator [Bailinhaonella thermotolerans]